MSHALERGSPLSRSPDKKLDNVGWCERCLRPFDRPTPSKLGGWKVCDDCMAHNTSARARRRKERSLAHKTK